MSIGNIPRSSELLSSRIGKPDPDPDSLQTNKGNISIPTTFNIFIYLHPPKDRDTSYPVGSPDSLHFAWDTRGPDGQRGEANWESVATVQPEIKLRERIGKVTSFLSKGPVPVAKKTHRSQWHMGVAFFFPFREID